MEIVDELAAISRRARLDLQGTRVPPADRQSAAEFINHFLAKEETMSSIYQEFQDKFMGRAKAIDARIRAEQRRVRADPTLSDLGKQQAIDAAVRGREPSVAALQAEARKWIDEKLFDANVAIAHHRAAAVEGRRKALGDQLLAAIYERQIGMMTPDEILQEWRGSAPGWERAIILEYGRLALLSQMRNGGDVQAVAQAQMALSELEGKPDPQVQSARDTIDVLEGNRGYWVNELDRFTYRHDIAAKLGVSAEMIDAE